MKLIHRIEFNQFPIKVKMSNARRPKYYKLGDKIPKRFKSPEFDKDGYLIKEGKRVLSNPRAAGTPKYERINGNSIYSGSVGKHSRRKMVNGMKDFFRSAVEKNDIVTINESEFPLYLSYRYQYDWIRGVNDADNMWIYEKVIQDVLVDTGFIPDDTIDYIVGSSRVASQCPMEQRKITLEIYSPQTPIP